MEPIRLATQASWIDSAALGSANVAEEDNKNGTVAIVFQQTISGAIWLQMNSSGKGSDGEYLLPGCGEEDLVTPRLRKQCEDAGEKKRTDEQDDNANSVCSAVRE